MKITRQEGIPSEDNGQVTLDAQQAELAAGEICEWEWAAENFERVAVLVETLSGDPQVEFQGPPGQFSKLKGVYLFAGRIGANAKKIALRVRANVASKVRVTVAFLKGEGKAAFARFSCKSCKAFCRLAVNALMAHLGLPLLSIDVPIPEGLASTAGQHLTQICLSAGQLLPEGLGEFFAGVSHQFWSALQAVVGVVDWLTEGVDRVFESVCRGLHCCK